MRIYNDTLKVVQAWRRGEDPHAEQRAELEDVSFPSSKEPAPEDLVDLVSSNRTLVEELFILQWYGRPFLEQRALAMLDRIKARPPPPWTTGAIRGRVSVVDDVRWKGVIVFELRFLMWGIAALRAADVALAALEERAAGPPGEDVEK